MGEAGAGLAWYKGIVIGGSDRTSQAKNRASVSRSAPIALSARDVGHREQRPAEPQSGGGRFCSRTETFDRSLLYSGRSPALWYHLGHPTHRLLTKKPRRDAGSAGEIEQERIVAQPKVTQDEVRGPGRLTGAVLGVSLGATGEPAHGGKHDNSDIAAHLRSSWHVGGSAVTSEKMSRYPLGSLTANSRRPYQ